MIILKELKEKNVIIGKDLTSKEKKQKEFYIVVKATKHTHTGFVDVSSLSLALHDWKSGFKLEIKPVERIKGG